MFTDWPPGPVERYTSILRSLGSIVDLDLFRLRHHRDGRRRGVDPALRLRRRNALDAVSSAFPFEDRVRAVAFDRERDLLVAAAVIRARLEILDLEAEAIGVARVHAVEVAGPERGLVAAFTGADLEDHVLAVGRVGLHHREAQLLLEPRRPLLELGHELLEVGVRACCIEIGARQAPFLRELVRRFELLRAPPDLRRLAMIVVDGRIRQTLLQFDVLLLELCDQVVEVGGHAADQRSRASSVISGTPARAFDTGQFAFAVSAASRKPASSRPGTLPSTVSDDLRDAVRRRERDGRRRVQLLGGRAASREPGRERHREARCVRRCDQLLGARHAGASVLGARRPADGLLADRAARRRGDRAAPVGEAALPRDVGSALGCHDASVCNTSNE